MTRDDSFKDISSVLVDKGESDKAKQIAMSIPDKGIRYRTFQEIEKIMARKSSI